MLIGGLGAFNLGWVRVFCRVFMDLGVCRGDLVQWWRGIFVCLGWGLGCILCRAVIMAKQCQVSEYRTCIAIW